MLRIVLVEDNPADAQMLETCLALADSPVEIVLLNDGRKALEYLTGTNVASQHDLVLLDLNLPHISGFDVLEAIRAHKDIKGLPVVVMSGSTDPNDIERCYRAGANSYITKPTHLDEIVHTVAQFVTYWSKCVKLPSRRPITPASPVQARD